MNAQDLRTFEVMERSLILSLSEVRLYGLARRQQTLVILCRRNVAFWSQRFDAGRVTGAPHQPSAKAA